jgi:hypothetical protein
MAQKFDQALVRRAGEVWRRLGGQSLCDVCGVSQVCELRAGLDNLGEPYRAKVSMHECGVYVPVIAFQSEEGTDSTFNTFRRGLGWSRRLLRGQKVLLHKLGAEEPYGEAVVSEIHEGVLDDLLISHAHENHLMKGTEAETSPSRLHKVLIRLYGKTYAAASETFCVVRLERSA